MTRNTASEFQGTEYSFCRFGTGKEKLVIFPSLTYDLFYVHDFKWYFQYLFYELCSDYTIYVLGRKNSLPVGSSTREMATDYAGIIKRSIGPAHVLGISLGGLVAQYFARDFPQYVKKLILVGNAYRMNTEVLQIARRWISWAKAGMWKEVYEDEIAFAFRGGQHLLFKLLQPYLLAFLREKLREPSNFIIAGQAGILHNSLEILLDLPMPVLMIAGTDDPYFSQDLFLEMNSRLPQSELLLFKGTRHGIYEENPRRCGKVIKAWLRGELFKKKPEEIVSRPAGQKADGQGAWEKAKIVGTR